MKVLTVGVDVDVHTTLLGLHINKFIESYIKDKKGYRWSSFKIMSLFITIPTLLRAYLKLLNPISSLLRAFEL